MRCLLLENHRLITVTISGGVGKTRTAMEAARRLLDEQQQEVWFVDLSPVADGAFVAGPIAAVLGFRARVGCCPLPSIAARLKELSFLLILDNCEHIIDDAAAAARTILQRCPVGITILATSRDRLAIGVSYSVVVRTRKGTRNNRRGLNVRIIPSFHRACDRD